MYSRVSVRACRKAPADTHHRGMAPSLRASPAGRVNGHDGTHALGPRNILETAAAKGRRWGGGGGEGDEEDGRRILETKQGARPVNRRLGEEEEGFCFFDAPLQSLILARGGISTGCVMEWWWWWWLTTAIDSRTDFHQSAASWTSLPTAVLPTARTTCIGR